ncbi:hypothetical protein NL676_011551 [Syzygium grande]|nr:hypothetical protein NL676_011551 [Syzygium grande]
MTPTERYESSPFGRTGLLRRARAAAPRVTGSRREFRSTRPSRAITDAFYSVRRRDHCTAYRLRPPINNSKCARGFRDDAIDAVEFYLLPKQYMWPLVSPRTSRYSSEEEALRARKFFETSGEFELGSKGSKLLLATLYN